VTPATGTLIAGATSPSIVTGLAASTTYFFVVTAVNASGESAPSAQASATTAATVAVPTAPTGVTAVGGANQVTVTWSAVAGATSYNIYYATTAGVTIGGAGVTKLTSVTSPDIVMGLAASTTYFFIVTAVNSAGESLPSAEVSATTSVPALDGAALYSANCAGCHNALASSNVRMRTAAQITTAIANNTGGMGFLSSVLSAAQITAIANALNF